MGRTHAEDFFPLEAFVAVHLLPRHLTDLAQGIERGVSLGLLQRKQVFLKRMIVEIQDDLCVGITAGHVLIL